MSKDSIFVALSTFVEHDQTPVELLKASGITYKIHSSGKRITKNELLKDAVGYSVIIAGVETYDEAVLNELPGLKCIVRCGVGVDAIDKVAAAKRNITILNTPDIPTLAVAELALSLYLSLSRNLRPQANKMGQKKWERLEAHLLSNKTLGIIGFGRIGRKIEELCRPFELKVIVYDPFLDTSPAGNEQITLVSKEVLLQTADIVSIHASLSGSETIIIKKEEFAKMKKGAILVNLSRGSMIDEEALLISLQSGHLAGAGLDVFSKEPYDGPLCELDNVILTPHSATLTIETRSAMEVQCVEKAMAFLHTQLSE